MRTRNASARRVAHIHLTAAPIQSALFPLFQVMGPLLKDYPQFIKNMARWVASWGSDYSYEYDLQVGRIVDWEEALDREGFPAGMYPSEFEIKGTFDVDAKDLADWFLTFPDIIKLIIPNKKREAQQRFLEVMSGRGGNLFVNLLLSSIKFQLAKQSGPQEFILESIRDDGVLWAAAKKDDKYADLPDGGHLKVLKVSKIKLTGKSGRRYRFQMSCVFNIEGENFDPNRSDHGDSGDYDTDRGFIDDPRADYIYDPLGR